MKSVTIEYGTSKVTREVECSTTIGDLRRNTSIQAVLGCGQSNDYLINGVAMPDDAVVPEGATVRLETRCNTKAS